MDGAAGGRIAYPGLRAFKREEFDIFFGRENCVDQMVDILAATRFLAVLGTSGSGKSSLVKTGLLNALELGYFPGAGSNWKIADFRPRGRPIRSLAEALLGLRGGPPPQDHEIEVLAAFLRRGPKSLVEWCKDGNLPEGWNLVLIADQFEELFRYEDYSGRQDAEAFVALLIESANDHSVPVHVVITMRSEYLRQCTLIEGLPEAINRGLYLAPRMTREECRQAIEGPAGVCGFSLEPALVNRLLNDLTDFAPWESGTTYDQSDRLGQRADQLPLMQHVLNLLWQIAQERHEGPVELKLADYEAVNGLAGALNRHADEIAATIPKEHADVIDVVFRSLVTGKTAMDAIRRPTAFRDLVALANGRRESVQAVLDAFRAPGRNFIVPDTSEPLNDDTIVDISHESLIRQWRRLSQCVADEARSADVYQQLTASTTRFAEKRGGLLTGLDLANIAAWWRAESPAEPWAARYGGHFAEAKAFLEQSEAAEAERKKREDEAQRQLIAGQEAAARSKQLQRLAYGLVAMLILALCGAVATTFFYASARKASELADARRVEAEKSAAAAAAARQQAEQAATAEAAARQAAEGAAALAKRAEAAAKKAETEAENQRRAADEARGRAVDVLLTSLRFFAGTLADRIDLYHRDVVDGQYEPGDLSLAGSLLADVARSVGVAGDATEALFDQLRPALAVQDWYSQHILPLAPYSGSESEGMAVPSHALARYQLRLYPQNSNGDLTNGFLTGGFLTVNDRRTGAITAGYKVPVEFLSARSGAAGAGGVALLVSDSGRLAVALPGAAELGPVADMPAIARIDDVRSNGGRIEILYAGPGDVESLAVLAPEGANWRVALKVDAGSSDSRPARFAGAAGSRIYALIGGRLTEIDTAGGSASALLAGVPIDNARLVGDRYLLATYRGSCPEVPGGLPDRFDSWMQRKADAAPLPDARHSDNECLALVDAASGSRLWVGSMRHAQVESARMATSGEIELLRGTDSDNFRVLVLAVQGDQVRTAERTFHPAAWSLDGFSDEYVKSAVAGTTIGDAFSPDAFTADRTDVHTLVAPVGVGNSIIGWRIGEDVVQAANVFVDDRGLVESQFLEVLAWHHGARSIERDSFALGGKAGYPAALRCEIPRDDRMQPSGSDPCRFLRAAFTADGNRLLVVTNYQIMLIARDGSRIVRDRAIAASAGPAGDAADQQVPFDFAKLMPLGTTGDRFLGVAAGNKLWLISRDAAGSVGTIGVQPIVVPHNLETVLQEAYADPTGSRIYLRTRRSVGLVARGDDGAWSTRILLSQQPDQPSIVGLAPMPKDRFAVLFEDGNLSVRRSDIGGSSNAPTAGGTSAADVPTTVVGIHNPDFMSAFNDRIILAVPQASVGYALSNGELKTEFIVPGLAIGGQLKSGEVVSFADGLQIFADPQPPKKDEDALVLASMREEERPAGQGGDLSLGFEILRNHAASLSGDGSDDTEEFACEPALMMLIRSIDRGLAEGLLDAVNTACATDDRRRRIVDATIAADAGGAEGNDGIVGLLKLASADELARAALVNTIRRVMPDAAAAILAYDPNLGLKPSGGSVEGVANGGALDPKAAAALTGTDAAHGGLDPFDHWLLAIMAERNGGDARTLTGALFDYALAERILKTLGAPVPAALRERRIALSRILSDAEVLKTYADVQAVSFAEEQARGQAPEAPTREASLGQAAAWLAKVQAASADPARLNPLLALVEEAFGKEQRDSDKAAAAEHFRTALRLYVGTLDDARRLRGELLALGDESAHMLAAGAVLSVIDRNFPSPIVYDVDARREVTSALKLLATPDAANATGGDFSDLAFGFLDFDYSSRNRAVDDSPREFLDELMAAERFFTARLEAKPGDPKWLALRGRVRFWMAQLDDNRPPEATPAAKARWLEDAIADFEAARKAGRIGLWDMFLLAQATTDHADLMIRSGARDWKTWADRGIATYLAVVNDPDFASLDRGVSKTYRQRLVFNGLTRFLSVAVRDLLSIEPLSGNKVLATDPSYDRAKAVDLAFDALTFAAEREAVVADATRRGLVEPASANWYMDRRADYLWGYTVASLGAAARIIDGANGEPGICDTLASHASDVERNALPVGSESLRVDRILAECPETTPRNLYFRARALSARRQDWAANADKVTNLLLSAARQGVAIAYHNLSVTLTTGRLPAVPDNRYEIADNLWTTYAGLTLLKGYPDIAPWLREGAVTPERQATFRWLAGKAAALGVAEAHADLGADAGLPVRERALHLKVAGRLFAAAGRASDADAAEAAFAALGLAATDLAAVTAEAEAWQEQRPATITSDLERKIIDLLAVTTR
ncbi:MAG: hypothetical protein J0H94_16720 [Rhizobiales bacterium]|nr:hypothetical protein [Hyphomicrobiales bacterium]